MSPSVAVVDRDEVDEVDEVDPEALSQSIRSKLTFGKASTSKSCGRAAPAPTNSTDVLTHKDTIDALKAYVTAPNSQNESESSVRLLVTSSALKSSFMEILFNKHMTIAAVKEKLMSHVGTSSSSMLLTLKDNRGNAVSDLLDDGRKLGFYSPMSGYVLHVVDSDGTSLANTGWLEDVSKVEKYVMSDVEYDARDDTYRKFKEARLREDPTWTLQKEIAKNKEMMGGGRGPRLEAGNEAGTSEEVDQEVLASHIKAGQRCEVQTSQGAKRGVVRVVGQELAGLPGGWFVGVEYDEPVGRNDGSVKGVRHFECADGYGAFVRPGVVSVGEEYVAFDDGLSDFSDEI